MANVESGSPRVVVLGSLVFDIAIQVDHVPKTHETVLASAVTVSAGGKGLCQAVAARRLHAQVHVIGRVGTDVFADVLLAVMDREGIDRTAVTRDEAGTHLSVPIVTPDGNNRIIGAPRSSMRVTPEDVDAGAEALSTCDLVLLQGETPLAACLAALDKLAPDALVVWNPAPASFSLAEMLGRERGARVSWLTPNETEATELTGIAVTDRESAVAAARYIQRLYPHVGVVVTLGDRGALALPADAEPIFTPTLDVRAVDPTAAGDVFSAAFGVALLRARSVDDAIAFANVAGALTTTRVGAVLSIPTLDEVLATADESRKS